MNNFNLIIVILAFLLQACDKPETNPELLDPIYNDIIKSAEEARKSYLESKNASAEAQKVVDETKPQTGEILYARKRASGAFARERELQQRWQYLEIRAQTRLKEDRQNYLMSWKQKKPWPNPNEYKDFQIAEQLRFRKSNWDHKERVGKQDFKSEKRKDGGEASKREPK